jgi:hypothetical protein
VHGGHYVVATPEPFIVEHGPEGVLHVAPDGQSLVVHTGIFIGAGCGGYALVDEIRLDGTPAVRLAGGAVQYHVLRHTRFSHPDRIDFAGRFVSRRHFVGVLHVRFGASDIGPACSTLWTPVSGWYARRDWHRYPCVHRRHDPAQGCEPTPGSTDNDRRTSRGG